MTKTQPTTSVILSMKQRLANTTICWFIKNGLRRKLHEYQKNIPPQVRAARMADEINEKLGRPLQYQNKGRIEYLITLNGPEPKEYLKSSIDYQHYIDKQLKPVAEAILPFIGLDFEQVSGQQLGLF